MDYGFICYLYLTGMLAHRLGDILFQPKSWAISKSNPGLKGSLVCTAHVLAYTFFIILLWATASPAIFCAIAIPHWVIDRTSLANKWAKIIQGRTFEAAAISTHKYREFDVAFTCIVYKDADEALHRLCLWVVIIYLMV